MAGGGNIRAIGKATRFKLGQSGNPGGRPRGLSITALVRAELQRPAADGSGITNAEQLAETVVDLAIGGHPAFVTLVWKYIDGDPEQSRAATIRELAEDLAARMGLDADALLADFERELAGA